MHRPTPLCLERRYAQTSSPQSGASVQEPPKSTRRGLFTRFIGRVLQSLTKSIAIGLGLFGIGFILIDANFRHSVKALLAQYTVPDNAWLYLNLNDLHVVDSPHSGRGFDTIPLVGASRRRRITNLELAAGIRRAGDDPRIKGIILSFNPSTLESRYGSAAETHLGFAAIGELRSALEEFIIIKTLQRKMEGEEIEPQSAEEFLQMHTATEPFRPYDPSKDVVICVSDDICIYHLELTDM